MYTGCFFFLRGEDVLYMYNIQLNIHLILLQETNLLVSGKDIHVHIMTFVYYR